MNLRVGNHSLALPLSVLPEKAGIDAAAKRDSWHPAGDSAP